jgi:HEAT repeat protein
MISCLIAANVALFAANEAVAVWERIYNDARSDDQRYTVMLKIMELKDKDFIPLLTQALDQINKNRIDVGTPSELYAKVNLARLIIQELGNLQATDAAEIIFTLYKTSHDPLLKADAAMTLGKIRAVAYTEQLARDLSDVNLRPELQAPRDQEILAAGLVQCLQDMHSPLGYEPVFLASVAWYSPSSGIKAAAETALPKIMDDPTDSLGNIIKENPLIRVKQVALAAAAASKATPDHKAAVARIALRIGIDLFSSDPQTALAIADLRQKAIKLLVDCNDKDAQSAGLLKEIVLLYKGNADNFDETLLAYGALGANGGDAAANVLVDQLEVYNERQNSMANTAHDKLLVRQIIAAMIQSKNPLVKPVLTRPQFIDAYDVQIRRDVTDALKTF